MALYLCAAAALSFQVAPLVHTQPQRYPAMTNWHEAGLGGPLPSAGFPEEAISKQQQTIAVDPAWTAPTETAAALVGAVACALAGYGLSAASADQSLAMLGKADMFNQEVLFTDILAKGVDSANAVGIVLLPLAVLYLLKVQGRGALTEDQQEEWVCVIDELAANVESICGPASFDSTEDGMTCIADESGASIRWVCV